MLFTVYNMLLLIQDENAMRKKTFVELSKCTDSLFFNLDLYSMYFD